MLTVRVQTEDEFLLLNEKEEFHPTSPAYKMQQCHHLPIKLSTAKETVNKLQISEIKRETRHRTTSANWNQMHTKILAFNPGSFQSTEF